MNAFYGDLIEIQKYDFCQSFQHIFLSLFVRRYNNAGKKGILNRNKWKSRHFRMIVCH